MRTTSNGPKPPVIMCALAASSWGLVFWPHVVLALPSLVRWLETRHIASLLPAVYVTWPVGVLCAAAGMWLWCSQKRWQHPRFYLLLVGLVLPCLWIVYILVMNAWYHMRYHV